MKKALVLILSLVVFLSCINQNKPKKDEKSGELVVLTVDELHSQGKNLVGKEVLVKGTVTHVCKESGARCFIMGSTEDVSLRIEAGKIGSFTQEQMGSELQIRGILQEVQLDQEDLTELQKTANGEVINNDHAAGTEGPKMHDIDAGKHDSLTQTKKLAEMNQKLAESKEGYVPVYYLDGLELLAAKK